jgi:hypothetical protein
METILFYLLTGVIAMIIGNVAGRIGWIIAWPISLVSITIIASMAGSILFQFFAKNTAMSDLEYNFFWLSAASGIFVGNFFNNFRNLPDN